MKEYKFIDRKKNEDKLLIILAGYKHYLWDKIFDRIIKYTPDYFDVCIVTSGLENETLKTIAETNNWSYLSTSINNLCLAQNICISLFDKAQYIFKMDEDIFLTKDCLEMMLYNYTRTKCLTHWLPSCIVPMINVNCVTYEEVLRRANKYDDFIKKFGPLTITNGLHHHQFLLENPEVAKFMWNEVNIDDTSLTSDFFDCIPCPVRFSIGLIMFERSTYDLLGGFDVLLSSDKEYERIGLGVDERELCKFAMNHAMPIMIDRQVIVGHFAYGPQTKEMKDFFFKRPELF